MILISLFSNDLNIDLQIILKRDLMDKNVYLKGTYYFNKFRLLNFFNIKMFKKYLLFYKLYSNFINFLIFCSKNNFF